MSVTQKRNADRRGPDGLTKSERATLRDPSTYAVEALDEMHWLASSTEAFADFDCYRIYDGRWWQVKSNTGSWHLVVEGACDCEDATRRRDLGDEGHCKHSAAAEACQREETARWTCERKYANRVERLAGLTESAVAVAQQLADQPEAA